MENSLFIRTRANNQYVREQFSCLQSNSDDGDEKDDVNDSLQVLLKKTWNIYGVSSMFGFDYQNERHLKLYGKRLREEISSILPQDNVTYDVQFTVDEAISSRPTRTDPPAIKIEVNTKSADKEEGEKCIYEGYLISWRTILAELDYEKSVKLPLLLCRGTKSTMAAVHLTISIMFDCLIVALPANDEDLRWLVPVILQPIDTENNTTQKGQVKFEYRIPGLSTSNTIAVKYDAPILMQLWTTICDFNGNRQSEVDILMKDVERFHKVLQHQMLQGGSMQLGLGILIKISLPSLTIMDNKVKAATGEVLNKILLYFNQKSIEVLHKLNLDSTNGTSIAS